jgi:hypothetical protein
LRGSRNYARKTYGTNKFDGSENVAIVDCKVMIDTKKTAPWRRPGNYAIPPAQSGPAGG